MMKWSVCGMLLLVLVSFSCKKKNAGPVDIAPTNLTFTADVSTNNSGNVTFTASATNAVNYEFDFGNGVFQDVPSGTVTYKYPASGNYTTKVTARSASGQTLSKTLTISVTVALTLVWSDEFNTAGAPDPARWGYDIGTGSSGWGNNELQFYTSRPENVSISNGTLKIVARREAFSGSNFTSARLLTRDKFSFRYGKVEARAKLPAGVGTWPAIWMLGANFGTVGWPACGEIDIMEHVGAQLNKIYGTLHYPGFSGGNAVGGQVTVPKVTTEFKVYSVEWTPAIIRFSVDGVPFFTFANTSSLPFNQNFFIIMNVAMGGNFGGPVESGFTSGTMEVDYIRVYQ
ncbi:MAG TPA: family 16 glycosylhydrolase [Lacibacter sp.]|nr:family 16 glycosylhydrolase [Lacibacter sp.]HMO89320.1 family 16 glycosylhydrolase [Lacibacter sp.]HMP85881.1 family 16 glycosylhydrolase [Lacibacter sp.]